MRAPTVITVRGVEFRIAFVNNFFSVNFYELKQQMLKAQQAYYDIVDAQDKVADGRMTPEAATKVVEDQTAAIKSIGNKDFFERRLDLVKEICEVNDIEYDRRFWERKTSPEDLVKFLDAVYLYGTQSDEDTTANAGKKPAKK